jgi:ABC-type uncharacterized transport system ATPase subunit
VQRVSDQVAILRKGELVAQGPIAQVMQRGEGTIYILETKGDAAQIQQSLAGQAWISSLQPKVSNGHVQWEIGVTDFAQAEAHLLRLVLANESVTFLI